VHPCRQRRGEHQRATITTVAAINCLYAEFDAAPHEAKPALLERIERLAPAPSVIVDSGGGFHAYWLLDQPFLLAGEAERERARQAQRRWVEYAGADPAAKDLARVLRVPGTLNCKAAYAPDYPAVAFVQADFARTYCLDELERLAAATAPVQQPLAPADNDANLANDVARAQQALARLSAHRCEQYDAWLHVGMALHAGLGDAGLALWEQWSRRSAKHEPGACAVKWRSFGQRPNGFTLASLFFWADQDTWADQDAPRRAEDFSVPRSGKGEQPERPETDRVATHLTDLGNARRFVAQHGADVRYVAEWGWMVWDGRRWTLDRTGAVMRKAKATVLAIADEVLAAGEPKLAEKIRGWARASEGRSRLEALIVLAQSEPGIPAQPEAFDTHDWLLTCRNGTLDLRTGQLQPHEREALLTRLVEIDYDPTAECPTWTAFLDRIMAGSEALIAYLQRAVGYALTGSTGEQAMFLLYGTGANGKSTFLEALRDLFGDYGRQTDPATFLARQNSDRIPNDIARLAGARFVSAIEVDEGRRLSEVLVKQVISGDTLTARFLNREFFEFRARFKLFLAANHKPVIRGTDEGIWRRIRLIPFTVTIPKAERDKTLPEHLRAELPGILAWAVRGCAAWQAHGLLDPPEVLAATETYRVDMDVVGAFIADCCVLSPHARADCAALYAAYTRWCEESGEFALSQRRFAQQLEERGLPRLRGAQGRWYRTGIGLRDDGRNDEPPSPPGEPEPAPSIVPAEPDEPEPAPSIAPPDHAERAYAPQLLALDAGQDDEELTVAEVAVAHFASPCVPEGGGGQRCAGPMAHTTQSPPQTTGPPGVDLDYVRRLLKLGDAEADAALERHCALRGVTRAEIEATVFEVKAQINNLPHGKEQRDE
jgi:putative DNA primase/helicase